MKLKKSLKKPEKAPAKKLSKPLKKSSGKKSYGDWPDTDYTLVDTSVEGDGYPRVSRFVPPGTMRKVFNDKRPVHTFMTVMPNDLRVAWDICGYCVNWVGCCTCTNGVSAPRSVEYIYDSIVAEMAGEEWSPSHPNYRIGTIQQMRRSGASSSRLRMPKISDTEERPKKLLSKKTSSEPLPEEAFDNEKLRKVAKGLAKKAETSLNQKLKKMEGAGKSKKLLKRKS